ncbi:hypothetical protein BDK51DRAFT_18228 [Blyttiomyces helicus]|uniref:Mitochondrial import inner membrane translocase subunit n=1 Tax=Blyttiomyces helicus TaxID=388810 RepID=A0A4P9WMQ3_9FUNG|nr:hypothetical protein BDK51DRAFT_18228 [Blyttiomyces helicus]|eukprot:RKO93772.1 hypothetical protein BDK51DRAFT_18228 [Blyttiomyces helicus]
MKDFMRLYANLVDRCFADCITDFTTKALSSKEVSRDEERANPCEGAGWRRSMGKMV